MYQMHNRGRIWSTRPFRYPTCVFNTCSVKQIQKFEFKCMVYYLQDSNELFLSVIDLVLKSGSY